MFCGFSEDRATGDSGSLPEAGPPSSQRVSEPSTLASPDAGETSRLRLGDDCLILAGPTAAGKTAIALPLAKRLNAEIVSVDSMAVYRTLDIGTAKPSAADQHEIRHHAIDLVNPSETFSVAAWLAEAARAVDGIRQRRHRVLFVGGTPLYLKALRDGLADVPAADPELRARLADRLKQEGSSTLHRELARLSPEAAARIHPNDGRRIIRGIEVATASSAAQLPKPHWGSKEKASAATMLIVDVPRKLLGERIAQRARWMFENGLVEEVQAAENAGGLSLTARQAAGYSEVLEVLAGRLSRAEAVEKTILRTRQLAKRQRTWLRSFRDAVWICS